MPTNLDQIPIFNATPNYTIADLEAMMALKEQQYRKVRAAIYGEDELAPDKPAEPWLFKGGDFCEFIPDITDEQFKKYNIKSQIVRRTRLFKVLERTHYYSDRDYIVVCIGRGGKPIQHQGHIVRPTVAQAILCPVTPERKQKLLDQANWFNDSRVSPIQKHPYTSVFKG